MPYVWVEPNLFLEYMGVCVYHAYKNDMMDNGCLEFHYTTEITNTGENDFDIRDLSCYNNKMDHVEILKLAIECGELVLSEFN